MARPALTIIAVYSRQWARADIDRSGTVHASVGRHEGVNFSDSVSAVLSESDGIGSRVWVLWDQVWLGEVDLPPSAVVGLKDDELSEAAAYEAEAVGGLSPAAAVTSLRRIRAFDGSDRFVVAQCPRTEMIDLAKVIGRNGGSLAAILHPAGVPRALGRSAEEPAVSGVDTSWARIELWDTDTVVIRCRRGATELRATGVPPSADWRRAVRSVLRAGDAVSDTDPDPHVMVGPGVSPSDGAGFAAVEMSSPRWAESAAIKEIPAPSDHAVMDMGSEETLRLHIAAWAEAISCNDVLTPVLKKPKAPAGPAPQILAGMLVFLVAIGFVIIQSVGRMHHIEELREAATQLQADRAELTDLRRRSRALEREVRIKSQDLLQLQQAVARRDTQRRPSAEDMRPRISRLLNALSNAAVDPEVGGQFSITLIQPECQAHRIDGIASSPGTAASLSNKLAAILHDSWRIRPAEVTPMAGNQSLAWRFSVVVDPVGAVSTVHGDRSRAPVVSGGAR